MPIHRLLTLLLLVAAWWIGGPVDAAERPNIVFILADDLGYGDLSCYGQRHFSTPQLDRMAAEGLRFTQHYAGSTVCAPSRACLMTGQHTGHVWQRANGKAGMRPDPADVCVPRLLMRAGYHCALIGKSPFIGDDRGVMPAMKGFEHFFGYSSHTAAHRYYPRWLWRNGEKVLFPTNQGKHGEHYSSDLFLSDALKWLEANAREPFFLHLCFQQPHADLNVPDKWRRPFLGRFEETPYESEGHYRSEAHPKSTFAGMVAHLDDAVGQVLGKLRELGIERDTIVLFASDNGAMSEGGWSRDYFSSSGPLRGGKRDLYEGGIRTPLIAWQPGKISPGVTDHVSAFWDFLPTACELAGVAIPDGVDGISYAPTLRGRPDDQRRHEYLYWEFHERGGKQAVRAGNWKAVRLNVHDGPASTLELYDLASDIGEERNVAAEHPDVLTRMAQLLNRSHTPTEHFRIAPLEAIE